MNIIGSVKSLSEEDFSGAKFIQEMECFQNLLQSQIGKVDALKNGEVVETLNKVKEEAQKLFRRFPQFLKSHEERFFSFIAKSLNEEIVSHHLDAFQFYKVHAEGVFKLFFTPVTSGEGIGNNSYLEIGIPTRNFREAYRKSDEIVKENDLSRSGESLVYELSKKLPITDQVIQFALGLPESERRSYALGCIVEALVKENRLDEAIACLREVDELRTLAGKLHLIIEKLLEQGKEDVVIKKIVQDVRFAPVGNVMAIGTKVEKLLKENKVSEAAELALTCPDKDRRDALMLLVVEECIRVNNLNEAEKLALHLTTDYSKGVCYLGMVAQVIPRELFLSWKAPLEFTKIILSKEQILKAKQWALLAPDVKGGGEHYREKALARIAHYLIIQERYDEALEAIALYKENRAFYMNDCMILLARHFLKDGNVDKAREIAERIEDGYNRIQVLEDVGIELFRLGRGKEAIALGKGDFTKEGRTRLMKSLFRFLGYSQPKDYFYDLLKIPGVEDIIEWTNEMIELSMVVKFLKHGVRINREQLDVHFSRYESQKA